jgi:hypothetical protein
MIAGGQIMSSLTDATHHAVGFADNSMLHLPSFGGLSVDFSSVLIRYTLFGDADLNGVVDVNDLNLLALDWQTNANWSGGDFDHNGFVDASDLGLLALNWQSNAGSSLADALAAMGLPSLSVPEPCVFLLLLPLSGFRLRRRQRSACGPIVVNSPIGGEGALSLKSLGNTVVPEPL